MSEWIKFNFFYIITPNILFFTKLRKTSTPKHCDTMHDFQDESMNFNSKNILGIELKRETKQPLWKVATLFAQLFFTLWKLRKTSWQKWVYNECAIMFWIWSRYSVVLLIVVDGTKIVCVLEYGTFIHIVSTPYNEDIWTIVLNNQSQKVYLCGNSKHGFWINY